MVMIVNSITPSVAFQGKKSNAPKVPHAHIAPGAAMLPLLGVLAGCPAEPNQAEPPTTVKPAAGATAGAAGNPGTGGVGGNSGTLPTTPRTINSELNAAMANAGISMPTDGLYENRTYDDYEGGTVTEILNTEETKKNPNTAVYDGVHDGLEKEQYTATYKFDETTGALTVNEKPLRGPVQEYRITMDDGYTVFTSTKTNQIAYKLRKGSNAGDVNVFDAKNNLLGTWKNYKTNGFLARLDLLRQQFGKFLYNGANGEIEVPLGNGKKAILPGRNIAQRAAKKALDTLV